MKQHQQRVFTIIVLFAMLPALADASQKPDAAKELAQQDESVAAEVRETARQDQLIEEKLNARLARVESLGKVEVEVTAGLVTLTGLVDDQPDRALAAQLAGKLENVVAVDNRLQIDTALDRRLAPVLVDGLMRLKRLVMTLPLLLVAAVIIFAADWLGRLIRSWQWPYRNFRNPFLADLLRQALRVAVLGAGILVALNLLGATALVSAVLGAAGIVGLALGFAFKDLVENYIAGILLSLRQPFAPHDHVVIEGHEGRVAALTSRATSLITLDGNHLRLPNALVFKSVILNYSRNPIRQLNFDIEITMSEDIGRTQQLILDALGNTPGLLQTPPPSVLVRQLTAAGVSLHCAGWMDQARSNFAKVKSEAIHRVKNAIKGGEPAIPTDSVEVEPDVSVETYIKEQVDVESRTHADDNLLRKDAPRE